MNKHHIVASAFLFIISVSAFAGWQVAAPGMAVPREPFFQAGVPAAAPLIAPPSKYAHTVFPNHFANVPKTPMYAISLCGSLKDNLERILGRYNWRVVWKAPYDYNFDGRVTGASLPNVIEKILQPFPLQAVMYMSNRTVAIVPRFKS